MIQTVDGLREVVVASYADVKASGLAEGVYVAGTGSTGAAETFLVLGCGYGSLVMAAAMIYRLPPLDFVPDSVRLRQEESKLRPAPKEGVKVVDNSQPALTLHNVSVPVATRTPQFWLMWTGFGFAITGWYVPWGTLVGLVAPHTARTHTHAHPH